MGSCRKKADEEYTLDILIAGDCISEDIRIELGPISIGDKEIDFHSILLENGLIAAINKIVNSDKDEKATCFSFPLSKEEYDYICDRAMISFIVQNISVPKHNFYLENVAMEKGAMKEICTFVWNPKKEAEELERKKLKKKQEKQN